MWSNRKAFSLIEMSIVMAIVAIGLTSAMPVVIHHVQNKAAQKTALEIILLQDAGRNYYGAKHQWPPSVQALKDEGFIHPQWDLLNPWGNAYEVQFDEKVMAVTTVVPTEIGNMVASFLPSAVIEADRITSSIPALQFAQGVSAGVIVAWSGAISDIPSGWVLCDGQNGTPDLRDKFIVGAREDERGKATTKILGELMVTGGSIEHVHGVSHKMNGIEYGTTEGHQLTINEMPSHDHAENPWVSINLSGPIGLYGNSPGGSANMFSVTPRTEKTGGDQAHAHDIPAATHIPPFYALAFIMKQ